MSVLIPIALAVVVGVFTYLMSASQTKRTLAAQSSPLRNPALEAHVAKLAHALDLKRLHVNIYEIDPINGLASPDGQIYITRGFLKKFLSGEVTAAELSSVIAHELGHVALGHTKRRMIDFSGQNAVRTALAVTLNRFIPFIGPWIANMAVNMIAAGMSRKDEFEADAYATALMIKPGLERLRKKASLRSSTDGQAMAGRRRLGFSVIPRPQTVSKPLRPTKNAGQEQPHSRSNLRPNCGNQALRHSSSARICGWAD